MIKKFILSTICLFSLTLVFGQDTVPMDTVNLKMNTSSYLFENFKGQETVYFKGGTIGVKDVSFLNGTIEYDIYLTEDRGFPGVYFRIDGDNAEQFYIRPHQSGNPDANQATPVTNGLANWQFYFGPKYSFPHKYTFNKWTHVKVVVNGRRAQVFLDNAETPQLSWQLFHEPKAGGVSFSGGLVRGFHIANIKIDHQTPVIENFNPGTRKPIENVIEEWTVSNKFEEKELDNLDHIDALLSRLKWNNKIYVEEGVAANIARVVKIDGDIPGNTVIAKLTITSDKDQVKLFDFGYSDRVVAFLNNKPIYKGNNRFRSRDYRYLGTIGLFDGIYLNLKKGKNTLLLAVSEDFGGWLVTGRFADPTGVRIK
ncbi:hypothetical protein [Flagellimonas myxillae]|uniref:hypothetical protein n=1 Tax=Flagellimonas myxillae TaxID=2942214 RepID=UPI00201F7CC0|nr:hypothetical protein [Muricauda myxillae]MCL6265911.1 hypothetical protein [Muricauda myxillae]